MFEWKKNNLNLERFALSVLLPSTCSEEYLILMFKNIEPVIDVDIIDVCDGENADEGMSTYTFSYSLFDAQDKSYVEQYLEGIGAVIIS